jgi:methionyl-tRNA synthetase
MEKILIENSWVIFPLILWVLAWKAAALWKAVKNNHKGWFVALFLLNTVAILEILYIFVFSKPSSRFSTNVLLKQGIEMTKSVKNSLLGKKKVKESIREDKNNF